MFFWKKYYFCTMSENRILTWKEIEDGSFPFEELDVESLDLTDLRILLFRTRNRDFQKFLEHIISDRRTHYSVTQLKPGYMHDAVDYEDDAYEGDSAIRWESEV